MPVTPRTLAARERQHVDALIDRPLRAFRAEIARMTDRDLESLRARLDARLVGAHYSLSAHGLARHLASQEIPLLERRLELVTAQQARPHLRQLRLVEPGVHTDAMPVSTLLPDGMDEQQAA